MSIMAKMSIGESAHDYLLGFNRLSATTPRIGAFLFDSRTPSAAKAELRKQGIPLVAVDASLHPIALWDAIVKTVSPTVAIEIKGALSLPQQAVLRGFAEAEAGECPRKILLLMNEETY